MSQPLLQYNAVMLAHAGEIGIKSKMTRQFMIKQLYRNIGKKFPDDNLSFKNVSNRTIVESEHAESLAEQIADTIFGISYTAPIFLFKWSDYQHLTTTIVSFASQFMSPGMSFGFEARTTGKNRPPSQSLKVELGSLLFDSFNDSLTVNLNDPDYMFNVEVREEFAWVYFKTFKGFDGFPQGAQKGVPYGMLRDWLLDYIALFQAMKRGINVRPVRFITSPADKPSKQSSWHDAFITKFSFRSPIDVPIYDLLFSWKNTFGDNLCSACMFFSEQLLSKASAKRDNAGFVSGFKIDSLGGDISSLSLKWFDEQGKTFKIRPNLFSDSDSLATGKHFSSFPLSPSCCPFQTTRKISYNLSDNEKNIILESVDVYQKKIFDLKPPSSEL